MHRTHLSGRSADTFPWILQGMFGMSRVKSSTSGCGWLMAFVLANFLAVPLAFAESAESEVPPNIVVIFTDDLGYGDLGCYGAEGYQTPHLDRMAREGRMFTDFYVSQAVCSASRASILTGCYNVRVGINGALNHRSKIGISSEEMTLGGLVQQKNYRTAAIGKWHLGYQQQFLPLQHGFDVYFGLPYSNDMWPYHPNFAHLSLEEARVQGYPDLPLIKGNRIINPMVTPDDQTQLTTQYTEQALKFLDTCKDQPFLLYLAHSMPHVPLFVSDKFDGKTERGLFGDVVEEIDWSVGQILDWLRQNDLDANTLVIFTSDNGPWLSYGNHAGSAGPFREGKGTTFEGGVRMPCIMRWPGKIPAGTVCSELAVTFDLLPTIASLTGSPLPSHPIDGRDISRLMFGGPEEKTPHDAFYYYWGTDLQAVRSGQWKLHFPHTYRSLTGTPGQEGKPDGYTQERIELSLFDLENDPGESTDVKADHPEVVARLKELAELAREELGDSATKRQGKGVRPPGRVSE